MGVKQLAEPNGTSDEVSSALIKATSMELIGQECASSLSCGTRLWSSCIGSTRQLFIRSSECTLSKYNVIGGTVRLAKGRRIPPDIRDLDNIGNDLDFWPAQKQKELHH
ncbi:MAG: hypothetical protein SGPRY_008428 [Prymnesium sp.]